MKDFRKHLKITEKLRINIFNKYASITATGNKNFISKYYNPFLKSTIITIILPF